MKASLLAFYCTQTRPRIWNLFLKYSKLLWVNTGSYFCSVRHTAAENLSSGIPLSVSVSPPKLLPWQRAANRGWKTKRGGGGVWGFAEFKKIKEEKTNFFSEQIYVNSLLSCGVNSCRSLALPPRSKQRDGVGSVSANTTSDGLKWGSAKHRMCGMKEKMKIKDFNQIKGGIQICAWARPHRRCLWADGWGRLNTLKIH